MAITVNVLCYKSKTLGNGEHPLMICVCMDAYYQISEKRVA